MTDLRAIAKKLEDAGVKHAPEQQFAPDDRGAETIPGILNSRGHKAKPATDTDGRYVTLRDPPGVYYLFGADCGKDEFGRTVPPHKVQIIFLGKQDPASIGKPAYLNARQTCDAAVAAGIYADLIGYGVEKIEGLISDQGSIPSAILAPWN